MAIVVLAAVIFLFDNLRTDRSVPLSKESGITCPKNSCVILVENRCFILMALKIGTTFYNKNIFYFSTLFT